MIAVTEIDFAAASQRTLRWAVLRGEVMRAVYGEAAVCPYAEGSLARRCWRYGHRRRETGRSVSRETTGKRRRQPRWSETDQADLARLLMAGFRYGEIALVLGRSYEGVEGKIRALRKAGAL